MTAAASKGDIYRQANFQHLTLISHLSFTQRISCDCSASR
jgi:hypothetical protein